MRLARRLARWSRGRIRIAPLTSPEAERALGDLPPAERFSRAWLVGPGGRFGGHEAGWHSLYLLPGGWLLRPLRRLPGFQPISRWLYDRLAERRGSTCAVEPRAGARASGSRE